MKKLAFMAPLAILLGAGLLAITACASPETASSYRPPAGPGGMMGPGSMMGPGGMMHPWGSSRGGMMEREGQYQNQEQRISIDQALEIVDDYLRERHDPDLEVTEIMEFSYNFYVEFAEKSTGLHAFEALIDPYTGDLYPEPGPNMMWNTKYGMMSGMMWGTPGAAGEMTVDEAQAREYAQEFINGYLPGAEVAEEADRFYGYYTLHVLKDGKIYGMLSVNGYTGQVWYHSWHGKFLGMKELSEH